MPLIRELLTDEEYAELLRRMVQVLPNDPLLDYPQGFDKQELKAPNGMPRRRWPWNWSKARRWRNPIIKSPSSVAIQRASS